MPFLFDLPDDVLGLILAKLPIRDLEAALRVNHWFYRVMQSPWFWKMAYGYRFGLIGSEADAKTEYMRNSCNKKSVALEGHIIWGDSRYYWEKVMDGDSEFGCVSQLHRVCWFEVMVLFESVPRGFYQISWRVKFMKNRHHFLDNLNLAAKVIPLGQAEQDEWTIDDKFNYHLHLTLNRDKEWSEIEYPSLLEVPYDFAQVKVQLYEFNNVWKYAVQLDWVKLTLTTLPNNQMNK